MTQNASGGRTSTTSPAAQKSPSRGHLYALPSSQIPTGESAAIDQAVPPHDVDLERHLLAVLILHGDYASPGREAVIDEVVATGLQAEDFYVPSHARVAAAVLELHAAGAAVDVHTVGARCHDRNDVLGLLEAREGTVRTSAAVWAQLVIEYARCRRVLPLVDTARAELLAGRLREVRLLLEAIGREMAA